MGLNFGITSIGHSVHRLLHNREYCLQIVRCIPNSANDKVNDGLKNSSAQNIINDNNMDKATATVTIYVIGQFHYIKAHEECKCCHVNIITDSINKAKFFNSQSIPV